MTEPDAQLNLPPLGRGLLIIPCYNEEQSLPALMAEVRQANLDLDVLVINDGSSDRTAQVARRLKVSLVDLPCNLGVGHAVQAGLQHAVQNGYDFIVRIDGDGQHPPAEIPKLLKYAASCPADVIVGSRFGGETEMVSTRFRYLGVKCLSMFLSKICKSHISDPTSGFWLIRRPLLKYFAKEFPTDYPEPEALALLRRQGYTFDEVPVNFRPRVAGVSSIQKWGAINFTFKVGLALVVDRVRPVNTLFAKGQK